VNLHGRSLIIPDDGSNVSFSMVKVTFLMGVVFLLLSGCGKKGDPLPPEPLMPLPPNQLSYTLEGNLLTLSWHDANKDSGTTFQQGVFTEFSKVFFSKPGGGVKIFQAVREQSKDACQTCPLMFEAVAVVDSPKTLYQHPIDPGFIYYYKLKSFTSGHLTSDDSETLSFEY
jgi:hypothetical protein